ncbi:hypothetical protein [Symmachiella dynata]|uniref:hypothetical protein n=1 Tax=Symmachiella dynata TaxID=2527995 RepID=UPI00119CE481|nr:hypothetical protein [Symmachiella dynata]
MAMRGLNILLITLMLATSGCHYLDPKYKPTGFSSTYHKYEVEEKIREWHAQQEKEKKLAELHRRLATTDEAKQDGTRTVNAQNKMSPSQTAR